MNIGICVGGPHDGDRAESEHDSFMAVVKVYPDVKESDGTWTRRIDHDNYYWMPETKTWRWGTHS